MADQYTPEEISEIFEAYNNAIKSGTPITAELARQMQDAVKATRGLARAQEEFGKSLGKSALQLSTSLYKGEKGVGQFGDAIESAATALQTLILAIPGLGIVAKVATVAMGMLAKGVNAAAKQGDALYKTYQDLGRAGATASDGISGVFRNMQNLGYGIEELDKMVQLVTQNSETLAKFSLTAADGTNAFAQGMAQIQRDGSLRILGKTTDDINAAGAAFIRQQVAAGRSQKDLGDSLGAQTKAYIMELDRLQRLTGISADALQKQQDEAMAEDAYNQVMSELRARAAAGDQVAEAQIKKITTTMATLGPEMRKEFILGIGGDVGAQSRLFMSMPSLLKNTMDETVSTQQTIQEANRDAANTIKTMGSSAKLAATGFRETFGPLQELRQFEVGTRDFDERNKAAAQNALVTDKATKALTESQIANMNSRDAMQSFIQKGVAPATVALSKLAGAASAVTTTGATAIGAPGIGGQRGALSFDRARAASGDVDRILSTIRQRESGGDYGAQAKGSTASGAYQFIDSTWQAMTKKFGMGQEYASAKLAPKEIQDAIAKAYVQDILKRAGGDVSKVPLEWYTGNIQGKMSPAALAANQGLTPEMYQSKWMSEYNKSGPVGGYTSSLGTTVSSNNLPSRPDQTSQLNSQQTTDMFNGFFAQMLEKLDTMNRTQRDQLSVQQKQLQVAS